LQKAGIDGEAWSKLAKQVVGAEINSFRAF